MGLLKTRKNKKFNYSPRYFKNEGEGSPYGIKHKFDGFRKTTTPNKGLKNKMKAAFSEVGQSRDRRVSRTTLLIVLLFVFLFLYIIDFDLSIFFPG
ncbi:MAG: riboflavin synthase subunit beta [Marinirhabdus sp.]